MFTVPSIAMTEEMSTKMYTCFVVVGLCIIGYLFFILPGHIARRRRVAKETIKSIDLLSLVGMFIGVTWIVAIVWACSAPPVPVVEEKKRYRASR